MHHHRRFQPARLVLGLIVIAALFIGYKWNQFQYFINTPYNPTSTAEKVITIKKGSNIKDIAQELSDTNLLLDAESFSWYARLNNLDKQIKTGRFALSANLNIPQILEIITSNKTRQEIVTIPEGSTVGEIDQILTGLNLINQGEFVTAVNQFDQYSKYSFLDSNQQQKLPHHLEGYLFPDTYYVSADQFSSDNFISLLLNTFQKKALPIIQNSTRPLAETVNVAAMVEKEANQDKDRPIIAGIIWKRLDAGWMLGIDATLLYLKNDRSIDQKDLQENSPYNTRNRAGLPPGPISNPGLKSLQAAAEPQESPYYFYLTTRDGQMVYAVSNEEHNANKRRL